MSIRKSTTIAAIVGLVVSAGASAAPIQWVGNGHWYEFVSTPVTGPEAFAAAAASSFMGMPGYLATVTSAEEKGFVSWDVARGLYAWLGGSDEGAQVNDWTWRVGPEAGQPFTFSNWAPGEPNNCCGGEDYVATNWNGVGRWNDFNLTAFVGYVIEYPEWYPQPVPEPASLALLGLGLAGLGLGVRRRQ